MKLKMHDELNSMDISKKMLELTTISFSPMNPAIPMKQKYSSSSHFRPHLTSSTSDVSNEGTNVEQNMDDCEDDDDDNSRASLNLVVEHHDDISLKSDSSSVIANNNSNTINLPSPPSSTRSSFDAITRDSFLSNGDISENNFDASHASSIFGSLVNLNESNNSNDNNNGQSSLEDMVEVVSKIVEDNFDDEIKFLTEELILNVIDSAQDDQWKSTKIDFDGETILPSGLRLVKGVADMSFYREEETVPPRFTNQLNFLKTILTKYICRYKTAVPFLNPVDSVRLKIPHYYLVIKQPMDLNTVKNRLNFLWYQSASECISDIRQIFKNCYKFNSPTDYVYSAGKKLEEYFDEKLKDMPPVETEIPCPPRQNIEEFQKLSEKKSSKRRSGSLTDSIDGQNPIQIIRENNSGGVTTYTPIKMITRSERGVMVRKPSKDLPAPISTPPVKQPTVRKVPLNKPLKECCNFVKELFTKKHADYAWPFWNPVDTQEYPDYLQKVKKPIDLSAIKTNIETGKYTTVNDFAKDMRLMFSNCLRYNSPESPIIEQVRKLREVFEYRYAQFPEDYFTEKLVIPKHSSSSSSMRHSSSSASTSSSHHHHHHHHLSESSHKSHNKKTKSTESSKKSSHKIRVSHNESGQMFNPILADRYNGNSNADNENVSSESRMKMLEMQVERLTCALTSALMSKGNESTASAILTAIGSSNSLQNGLQNGTKSNLKKPSRKNGYKTKNNNKRLSQKSLSSKKRKHLSSEEEEDSDADSNSLGDLSEPFNPENIDDLKKLKNDLENLHATDLQNVLRILQSTEPSLRCDDEQNVEIDFEALKPKTLIALRKYVTSCMLNNTKASPSSHHNRFSSSSNPSSSNLSSSTTTKSNKKFCHTSLRGSSYNNFDTDCDNSIIQNNWSRADSRASNLQLSESSSDSEIDE